MGFFPSMGPTHHLPRIGMERTHGGRMPLVMKQDKALDPSDISPSGAKSVLLEANLVMHEVQEFRLVIQECATV
jgi:hypothetical protein